jgi:NADPH-dependent curcumin reductase CurA
MAGTDGFAVAQVPVTLPADGEVLVRTLTISVDP